MVRLAGNPPVAAGGLLDIYFSFGLCLALGDEREFAKRHPLKPVRIADIPRDAAGSPLGSGMVWHIEFFGMRNIAHVSIAKGSEANFTCMGIGNLLFAFSVM